MGCIYKEIKLQNKNRGVHLITNEIIKNIEEIKKIDCGTVNIFIKHTSASITINENTDIDVRKDFEYYLNTVVPEKDPNYTHIQEGLDDMPAHIKSILIGNNITIPFKKGKLSLGMWQGIYLCEHRNKSKERTLIITINY